MFRKNLPIQTAIVGFACLWLLFALVLAGCNLPTDPQTGIEPSALTPTVAFENTATPKPDATRAITPGPTLTATLTPSPTRTPEPTSTATASPTPTQTSTNTITPTYAILRAKVLVQANCRYGPGAPYLYKYGVYPETVLEIIGRNDLGTWVVVQAIGGTNPCWVKADLLEIRGDVMAVAPMYLELPRSPYYGPMTQVSATREGSEVTVFWNGIQLRAGDDSEQTPYVIEAWVCQDGQLIFTPVGSYGFAAKITDEPGCAEPSHGRITAAEKHGYTAWVEIPWPPHEED
jgi:hypothetical protein